MPAPLTEQLSPYFALAMSDGVVAAEVAVVAEDRPGQFRVLIDGHVVQDGLSGGDIVVGILEALDECLLGDASMVPAGLVERNGAGALLLGRSGTVADVTAWLIEGGFAYHTQRWVMPSGPGRRVTGIAAPVSLGLLNIDREEDWTAFLSCRTIMGSEVLITAPLAQWRQSQDCEPRLAVILEHVLGSDLAIGHGTAEQALSSIDGSCSELGRRWLTDVLSTIPCLRIRYGSLQQMQGVVDVLLEMLCDRALPPDGLLRLVNAFSTPMARAAKREIPARTDRELSPKLTIGMATYDDYDGVYFSIQSIRMHHPEILEHVEFVVIDNNPAGVCGTHLKALERHIPNYRYIPQPDRTGTAVRDQIFAEAYGDYVMSMDCHVLFPPGALEALLGYFEANPHSVDLIQGPMLWDNLREVSSHWDQKWQRGMFGTWATDSTAYDLQAAPFEIPMQGLGVFACRKQAWPGFNPDFKGFGGEEGYLHEKFRQAGGRVLCLPAFRWLHRFARPLGVPYVITWGDRIRNYILGRQELGLPFDDVVEHMRAHVGERLTDEVVESLLGKSEAVSA
jgi:hypothetical protein